MKKTLMLFYSLLFISYLSQAQTLDTLWIADLDLRGVDQGWGQPEANLSVDREPLTISGTVYGRGLGTHAISSVLIDLKSGAHEFSAAVGVDDKVLGSAASVEFIVSGDQRELWRSGVMKAGQPAQMVRLPLNGLAQLELTVTDAGDGIGWDHADWAQACILYSGDAPQAVVAPLVEPYLLTPAPSSKPRINGARIYGCRLNHSFLYKIPATGDDPLRYQASGLPAGLTLDGETGIISGQAKKPGEYPVTLQVANQYGRDERIFKIVIGDRIALTPPLGWNSWNCFACDVDDAKIRSAADALVSSGLADHGWSYINIDDCWAVKPGDADPRLSGPERDAKGSIRTNQKFPDMKALCDYIHAKGLKAGIYSSPGALTCAGYAAAYQYELQDARQFAEWGFDYLKYDWCSYGRIARDESLTELQKPYQVMRRALDRVDRDIIFSLCQYGMGDVWKWGESVGGNSWRTTGDITDTWASLSGIGFSQAGHEAYAGPGHWNDPDMLVVGWVGWGPQLHPTHLTPDEQYTHITLWTLLASPLLIGCDLTRLDAFTLNLLTNDEVLEVHQDPLGRQARRVGQQGPCEVWARPLEDGSLAVGLFNRSRQSQDVAALWSELGLKGKHLVRDLWRQEDIGAFEAAWGREVPAHGAALVKIY